MAWPALLCVLSVVACNEIPATSYKDTTTFANAERTAGKNTAASNDVSSSVHVFYYPWYGNPQTDGGEPGTDGAGWRHWQQNFGGLPHTPPNAIGASFYPSLGPYSSSDPATVDQHMAWIAEAKVGVVVVSWWGQGSWEDERVPLLLRSAHAHGLKVAFHLEPYPGSTAWTIKDDITYLYRRYGDHPAFYRVKWPSRYSPSGRPRGLFYVFNALAIDSLASWRVMLDSLRGGALDAFVIAQPVSPDPFKDGHFDGLYTHDVLKLDGTTFAALNRLANLSGGVFSASVGPGFDESRAVALSSRSRSREDGSTYDAMWRRALESGAAWVNINSFNEWHEGTQIEPATTNPGGHAYKTYRAAYGLSGADAERAYLNRTRGWVERFLSK